MLNRLIAKSLKRKRLGFQEAIVFFSGKALKSDRENIVLRCAENTQEVFV